VISNRDAFDRLTRQGGSVDPVLRKALLYLDGRLAAIETALGPQLTPGTPWVKQGEPDTEPVLGTVLDGSDQGVSTAVEAPETPEQEAVPPYIEWSNAELQDELRARGLTTSGDKATMANRLTRDDQS